MELIVLRNDSESAACSFLPVGEDTRRVSGRAGGTGRRRDPDFCCARVCVGRRMLATALFDDCGTLEAVRWPEVAMSVAAEGGRGSPREPRCELAVLPGCSPVSDVDTEEIPLYVPESTPLSDEAAENCSPRRW